MPNRNLEGRKVALFVVLVIVALACFGLIVDSLFFAKPRTSPEIEKSHHGLLYLPDNSTHT